MSICHAALTMMQIDQNSAGYLVSTYRAKARNVSKVKYHSFIHSFARSSNHSDKWVCLGIFAYYLMEWKISLP